MTPTFPRETPACPNSHRRRCAAASYGRAQPLSLSTPRFHARTPIGSGWKLWCRKATCSWRRSRRCRLPTQQLAEEGRRLVASETGAARGGSGPEPEHHPVQCRAWPSRTRPCKRSRRNVPAATDDQALADACDKRIAQLREQANLLEDDRLQLRARQEELNARVDKQNAWARDYGKRKGAQDSHDRLNQRDSDEWLGRAKQFLASGDFTALSAHAGNPQACSVDQIERDRDAQHPRRVGADSGLPEGAKGGQSVGPACLDLPMRPERREWLATPVLT